MKASGEWAQRSACLGADPDLFFVEKGQTFAEGRKVCATCPVVAECLDAAVQRREGDGLWGGASERERRRLKVAWLQKMPGHTYRPGHGCAWCCAIDGHIANLQDRQPVNLNGPGIRHGKASSYARGCRCPACKLRASAVGRRLVAAGRDVADWWPSWFGTVGPDADPELDEARLVRAKALAELDVAESAA